MSIQPGKTLLFRLLDLHIWVLLAAVAQAWLAQSISGQANEDLLLFLGFGTWAFYAAHDAYGRWRNREELPVFLLSIAAMASIVAGVYGWQLEPKLRSEAFLASLFAIAYTLPILNGRRIRDIGWLKAVWLVSSWIWLIVVLPQGGWSSKSVQWLFVLERFFFTLSLTLAFDFRDLDIDIRHGVKTWVGRLGKTGALQLSRKLLLLSQIILAVMLYQGTLSYNMSTSLIASSLLGWIALNMAYEGFEKLPWATVQLSEKSRRHLFSLILDGLLILPLPLYWLGSKIFPD